MSSTRAITSQFEKELIINLKDEKVRALLRASQNFRDSPESEMQYPLYPHESSVRAYLLGLYPSAKVSLGGMAHANYPDIQIPAWICQTNSPVSLSAHQQKLLPAHAESTLTLKLNKDQLEELLGEKIKIVFEHITALKSCEFYANTSRYHSFTLRTDDTNLKIVMDDYEKFDQLFKQFGMAIGWDVLPDANFDATTRIHHGSLVMLIKIVDGTLFCNGLKHIEAQINKTPLQSFQEGVSSVAAKPTLAL